MPVAYSRLAPRDRYKLRQAATEGSLLQVQCMLCRRPAVVFLASDLVQLFDPERDAYEPPWPCSECGKDEFVRVKLRTPFDAEVGKLIIRRLVRIKRVPIWRNTVYGEDL